MITAIASQKGGSGKTTTSITLAAGLAHRGKRVLLVDLDFQSNSSKVIHPNYQALRKEDTVYVTILNRQPLVVHHSSVPGLDVVPSHILMSNTDVELTTAKDHREARLKRVLDDIKERYDYVFIDCPPAINWLVLNALTAADAVLVPVSPGYFELDSVVQISKTIAEVREFFNPQLRLLGYVFTKSDPTNNSKVSLKLLRQAYTDDVVKTVIPLNTDIRDAHFNKRDVFTYSPQSKSAEAYNRLIEELFL